MTAVAGEGADRSPRLGMHVSIAGGLPRMAERARDFACEAVQVFSRSPQGGPARPIPPEEAAATRALLLAADIRPLVIHMPYFANLCAADVSLRAYASETLAGELERAALLGAPYVVTHPGRPGEGTSPEEARGLVVESVLRAFEMSPAAAARVRLLLENTSGSGRELGSSLEEIATLAEAIETGLGAPGRVGFCLDTCHAHAAGYDLRGARGVAALARRATELLGRDRLAVVHANDSLGEVGSRRDRHAPIGGGTIGEAGFRALLAEPHLAGCPFLVETPGSDEHRAADLARLKRLRAGEALEG